MKLLASVIFFQLILCTIQAEVLTMQDLQQLKDKFLGGKQSKAVDGLLLTDQPIFLSANKCSQIKAQTVIIGGQAMIVKTVENLEFLLRKKIECLDTNYLIIKLVKDNRIISVEEKSTIVY